MAARATRSASRKARLTEAVATGPLGALSHDELGVIVDGLADPLQPVVAVALSSTCLGLRTPLQAALEVLKERHARAVALCRKLGMSCAELRVAEELGWYSKGLTADDMATLAMILMTNGLPRLQELYLMGNSLGNAGMQALCEGLGHGAVTSLQTLYLGMNNIGPAGAEALAAALAHEGDLLFPQRAHRRLGQRREGRLQQREALGPRLRVREHRSVDSKDKGRAWLRQALRDCAADYNVDVELQVRIATVDADGLSSRGAGIAGTPSIIVAIFLIVQHIARRPDAVETNFLENVHRRCSRGNVSPRTCKR